MSRAVVILFIVCISLAIFSENAFATKLNCNRENEEYQCGSACQTTCFNLGQLCPIINIRCNDACYCKEGYARITDYNSSCIPISNCRWKND